MRSPLTSLLILLLVACVSPKAPLAQTIQVRANAPLDEVLAEYERAAMEAAPEK